jgi:hypothetical protein
LASTRSPNADSSDAIGLPPLPVALEKQRVLRLVKQNAPAYALVIDRIEKLSENRQLPHSKNEQVHWAEVRIERLGGQIPKVPVG